MTILKYIDSVPLKDYIQKLCPLGQQILHEVISILDLPHKVNEKHTIYSITKKKLEIDYGSKITDDEILAALNKFLVPGVPLYNIKEESLYGIYAGWSLMSLFTGAECTSKSNSIFITIDNRIMGYFQYLSYVSKKHNLL